jgi:hypothetical protein
MASKGKPTVHVYPVDDLLPHITEGLGCPCSPRVEQVEGGGTVIIHNSYDGREKAEEPVSAA